MDQPLPATLIQHLCNRTSLSAQDAEHLIREILHYYDDTADEFIVRRHRDLQLEGLPNAAIYACIKHELSARRFRVSTLTLRQIRRVIYG